MFFGGLNGDGFHGEEYDSGYGDCADDYRETSRNKWSYNPLAYHQEINFEIKQETEKAYLLSVGNKSVDIWVPKSWCRKMNNERTSCYIWWKGFITNLRKAIEKIKEER